MITSRERVRRAIRFDQPDRIPFFHGILPGAFMRHDPELTELVEQRPDDCGNQWIARPDAATRASSDDFVEFTDEWGSAWRRHKGMATGEVLTPAIQSWVSWPEYRLPPAPEDHIEQTRQKIAQSNHQWFAFSDAIYFFERMQYLRGSENLFIDIAEDRPELHELADRLVDWSIDVIHRYVDAGVDAILFGDDWGEQHRLLISPDYWRAFFKPRYKRMFDAVKEAGAFVYFHTDGFTWDILDDLVELGVDILNPQHHLMGTAECGRRLGGRVCIRSDLDRQHILPFGTPAEVVEAVREIVQAFARPDGGLILHAEIAQDVPWDNIKALYHAFDLLGCSCQAGALPE